MAAATAVCTLAAQAQTGGSNSSYSRFGLGTLSDASSSYNRSMGGVGVALRAGNRVNMLNPASYSACDSLSFILDMGMSFSMGTHSTATARQRVKNTSLDNVNAMFRLRRDLGMSVGFVPFSSIGYSFSQTRHAGYTDLAGKEITTTGTYAGDGGLHNVYAGLGWRPFKGFSIGANIGYVWGEYNHTVTQTFSEGGTVSSIYDGLHTTYSADLRTYKIDAGLQYEFKLSKTTRLVAGATVGIGHKIDSETDIMRYTANGDTVQRVIPKSFDMPWSYGVGLSWVKLNKWVVSADYRQERWGDCRMPTIVDGGKTASDMVAEAAKGNLRNRHHIAAGLEYTPDIYNRGYFQRIRYRLGANYSTPYYNVNGAAGPKQYSVCVGLGLPISNSFNNRSVVNLGFQWARVQPGSNQDITENYYQINVGVTFNEQWFMKWKIR